MINPLSVYEDCGSATALAVRQHDQGRVTQFRSWFQRARALEAREDRAAIDDAFSKGYASYSIGVKPNYFK